MIVIDPDSIRKLTTNIPIKLMPCGSGKQREKNIVGVCREADLERESQLCFHLRLSASPKACVHIA